MYTQVQLKFTIKHPNKELVLDNPLLKYALHDEYENCMPFLTSTNHESICDPKLWKPNLKGWMGNSNINGKKMNHISYCHLEDMPLRDRHTDE